MHPSSCLYPFVTWSLIMVLRRRKEGKSLWRLWCFENCWWRAWLLKADKTCDSHRPPPWHKCAVAVKEGGRSDAGWVEEVAWASAPVILSQPSLALCLELYASTAGHHRLLLTVHHLYTKPPKALCLGREGDATPARKVCDLGKESVSRTQVCWKSKQERRWTGGVEGQPGLVYEPWGILVGLDFSSVQGQGMMGGYRCFKSLWSPWALTDCLYSILSSLMLPSLSTSHLDSESSAAWVLSWMFHQDSPETAIGPLAREVKERGDSF